MGAHDIVVNLQGDLPTISIRPTCAPHLRRWPIRRSTSPRWPPRSREPQERTNPNVVKVIGSPLARDRLRALYFTRATAPYGDGPLYHHIGLYAYRRAALERFVALPPSALERREKLEQLRALEAGMRIDVAIVRLGAARRRYARGPRAPRAARASPCQNIDFATW